MNANAIVRIFLYVRDIAKVAAFYQTHCARGRDSTGTVIRISSRGASARRANR